MPGRVEGSAVAFAFAFPARAAREPPFSVPCSLLPTSLPVLTPPQSPRVGLLAESLTFTKRGPNHDESQRVPCHRGCHAIAGFVPSLRAANRQRRPRSPAVRSLEAETLRLLRCRPRHALQPHLSAAHRQQHRDRRPRSRLHQHLRVARHRPAPSLQRAHHGEHSHAGLVLRDAAASGTSSTPTPLCAPGSNSHSSTGATCRSPDGKFSEYGPQQWNLAATAFAVKFISEALRLLKTGPPITPALHARAIDCCRKAVHATLYDPDLLSHGKSYSNQFTNIFAGGAAFLAMYPDADALGALERASRGQPHRICRAPAATCTRRTVPTSATR